MSNYEIAKAEINRLIGARIKLARTSRFYYQNTLAHNIGVSDSMISKVESGDRTLSAALLFKIAVELKVNESELNPFRPIDVWGKPLKSPFI